MLSPYQPASTQTVSTGRPYFSISFTLRIISSLGMPPHIIALKGAEASLPGLPTRENSSRTSRRHRLKESARDAV